MGFVTRITRNNERENMWSVLLLVGLTKAVSNVAGIASTVDEKSGESSFFLFSSSLVTRMGEKSTSNVLISRRVFSSVFR